MRPLLTAVLIFLVHTAGAGTVRLAPEFTFLGAGDRARSLKSLRGQSVVLVIGDSAKNGAFRKQLRYLEEIYQQFASRGVVIIAAVQGPDDRIASNIPVARATNGAAVSSAYGVEKGFQIAIIGSDGNLDYQTGKVLPPERVRDVIQNSFAVQASERK